MTLNFSHINWIAVAVSALAVFFLGAVWYMALFGKLWQKLHGFTDEQVKAMQKAKPPHIFFGGMIVSYLILAAGFAVLMSSTNILSVSGGLTLGLLMWVTIALPIGITSWLASDRHPGIYLIDLAYQLTFLLMVGLVLGAWR